MSDQGIALRGHGLGQIVSPFESSRLTAFQNMRRILCHRLAARALISDLVVAMKFGVCWEDPVYQFDKVSTPVNVGAKNASSVSLPIYGVEGCNGPLVSVSEVFFQRSRSRVVSDDASIVTRDCSVMQD